MCIARCRRHLALPVSVAARDHHRRDVLIPFTEGKENVKRLDRKN
jgi:hypothetical protein